MQAKPGVPLTLHAGPIELKFQDGQIRYLRAGGKEVVRRIYFAVRNKNWGTVMPEYSKMDVENSGDGFRVQLAARCKSAVVDYEWSGVITVTKDGRITFDAEGTPNIDFGSNRIGLCTLFGAESLVGQSFETANDKGEVIASAFPEFVSPELVGKKFQTLSYATSTGMKVKVALEGATFDMEDQRNWGDTSFKAYAPLKYAYPDAKKGQREHEIITLDVSGAPELKVPAAAPIQVRVSNLPIAGAKVPAFDKLDPALKSISFVEANMNRKKFADATELTFNYTSLTHLPDDDTMMENVRGVWHQARTARQFAPNAKICFAPVRIQPNAGDPADPRNSMPIGAAWTALVVKYLSLGGVNEMSFSVGPGQVDEVIKNLAAAPGKALLETEITPADAGVDAFAIDDQGVRSLWVINATAERREVSIDTAKPLQPEDVLRMVPESGPKFTLNDKSAVLTLLPYEVCLINLPK